MKTLLLFCWCLIAATSESYAQTNDFVLLKKRGKTVQRLFAGRYMMVAIDGAGPYPCLIKEVFKDSLRLMSYSLLNTGTSYGGSYIDTVGRFYFNVHYQSITSFYTSINKKFNISGSGGTLMAAGLLGLLMTGVNAAYLKEKVFSGGTPWFAAGSAAMIGLGYLIVKNSTGELKIGKKYKLVYVKVNG